MTERNQVERAIKVTLENAQELLRNSRVLEKQDSIGHATSLAVLGFEEAHKAYLTSFFLPLFDGIISQEYRDDLRGHLKKHEWKQLHAKEFRTGLEYLLKSGGLSEDTRELLGIPVLSKITPSTEYAFSKKLNKMKNDGLYADPFRNPIWYPAGIKLETLKAVQELAATQIKSVKRIVTVLSAVRFLPSKMIEPIRNELALLSSTLDELKKGISNFDELKEKLSEFGETGSIMASLVTLYLGSERMKQIQREKKRMRT
ncbi:MAG: AbiV family abortive infection protein [Candidatus Thorarchaeota archaeon SMTZ1-45]|nr:MAG: hypothetical protein AM325_15190 [Candidatus Thorarchaeota archaeon SMTZ1-45]